MSITSGPGSGDKLACMPTLMWSDSTSLSMDCRASAASAVRGVVWLETSAVNIADPQSLLIYGNGTLGVRGCPDTTFHPVSCSCLKTACIVLPTSDAKASPPSGISRSGLQVENLNFCPANLFRGLNGFLLSKRSRSLGPSQINRLTSAFRISACCPMMAADSFADFADVAASPASSVITASSWSLFALSSLVFDRNWLLIDATSPVAPASPNTPPNTTRVANISNQNLHDGGLSGGRRMPRRQSCKPSRCSETMTTISPAIPMPTATAQSQPKVSQLPAEPSVALRELSNAEMELSKADIQLSKEEESAGQIEGRLARCWIITSISLLCLSGLLIVALGLNTIYKKYINRR